MSYIYNLTDTWNAGSTAFNGIKMAITNTASASGSYMLNLSTSGATTANFTVDKSGNLNLTGSVNKVTFTAPANGSTLTIADGKTLSSSNTLTFAGTDGSTLNVGAGGTLAALAFKSQAAVSTDISGLGVNVSTALGLNVGTAGAFVTNGGALGTPTSGDFTSGTFTWPTFNQNTTGTASNVSGIVAVGNGGSGLSSLATGRIPYGTGTTPFNTSADLYFNGNFGVGTNGAPDALIHGKGSGDIGFRITKTSQSDYMMQTLDAGVLRWYSFTDSAEIFRFVSKNFLLGTSNSPTGSAKLLAMGTATAPTADVSAGDVALWFDGTNLKARVGATVRTISWT